MEGLSRRRFMLGSLAGLLMVSRVGPSWAAIANTNEAINKAGRLRMLSQRIAKGYAQLGQGILAERSRFILDRSLTLFAEHLAELIAFAPSPDIRATYTDLDRLWQEYRGLVSQPPSLAGARKVAALNEDVLRMAHLGTTQLELHSGSSVGRLINISGRQRMLSQRLAKFYMLRRWGITSPDMEREAVVARSEFVSALDALGKAPENTQSIKAELELAKVQWLFFDEALRAQGGNARDGVTGAENIATTSERLLEVMDRITGMYARLTLVTPATPTAPATKKR